MSSTQHKHPPTYSSLTRNFIRIMITLIVMTGAYYLIYINQQLTKTIESLTSDSIALKQQQTETKAQLDSTMEQLNSKQVTLDRRLDVVSKKLSQALEERWYQNNNWLLLKARYYMEMANINAYWSYDTQTTSALLQQSDKLLANLHDPELFMVRQAIANELAQLQSTPTVDVVGLLAKLDATTQLLTDLPVKNPLTLTKTHSTITESNAPSTTWRAQVQNSIQLLEKLVVIRHHNEAIQPLIAPEYEALLRESVFLNLQEAQWAVMQRNQDLYHLSLEQAINTIKRAFDVNAKHTQTVLQQLHALQEAPFNSQKPITGESLLRLNQWIESKQSPSAAVCPAMVTPVSGAQS